MEDREGRIFIPPGPALRGHLGLPVFFHPRSLPLISHSLRTVFSFQGPAALPLLDCGGLGWLYPEGTAVVGISHPGHALHTFLD